MALLYGDGSIWPTRKLFVLFTGGASVAALQVDDGDDGADRFGVVFFVFFCFWNGRMRDATFNAEDGFVKFYLRGRPVIVYAPTPLLDSYNLSKINMAPQARLKMEWVYPFQAPRSGQT